MPVMLGGPKARGQRILRGIVVSYQYVNGEPALVLFPLRKFPGVGAMIVCLSAAWQYMDDNYLAQSARKGAETMGLGTTKAAIYNVATVINECLEDLVKMKPEPEEHKQVIGEGSLSVGDGSKAIEFELTE